MPSLSVRSGKGPAKKIELRGVAVVGRDASCSIAIDDKKASRQHARVFANGKQFFVEDLASRNGTLLNGAKIQGRVALKDGDEIRVGDHAIVFEGERPVAPLPRSTGRAFPELRSSVQGAGAGFVSFVFTVLIFGAVTFGTKTLLVMLLK